MLSGEKRMGGRKRSQPQQPPLVPVVHGIQFDIRPREQLRKWAVHCSACARQVLRQLASMSPISASDADAPPGNKADYKYR
jgi:hypothetical protein